MTVLITIQSPDSEVNRALGYWISNMRDIEERKWYKPRGLFRRLLDALKPDHQYWNAGGGNAFNRMPGMAFSYSTKDFRWDPNSNYYVTVDEEVGTVRGP